MNKQSKKETYKCENINNISNFIIKSPENISSKPLKEIPRFRAGMN